MESVDFARAGYVGAVGAVNFLVGDPCIVVLPADVAQATALGTKVYSLAADPFKCPGAVLISAVGKGHGDVGLSTTRRSRDLCRSTPAL